MIHYSACPVCQSAALGKVLTATDHTVSGKSFEIWQCAGCSVRLTQDVPPAEHIGAYYKSEDYISHTESKKGLINSLYLLVRRYTLSSKRKLIEKVTGLKTGSLLDVGAGTGAFVSEMNRAGWNAEGIEPDEQAIARASAVHGLKLHPLDYLFQLPQKSFNAITLWHVLEHVHELDRYLLQLKSLCRDKGKLIIAVPNYTSADAEYYQSHWAAYDVPRHLYHFSPAAMGQLITSRGGTIDSLHGMWFDSFYVSMLSEKYKSGSSGVVRGFMRGFRSNLKALSNRRRCSSIIYVISF